MHFYLKVEGEGGLGFIYSFFATFILFGSFFYHFLKFLKGEWGHGFFSSFKKKNS
jgi:hypothetical protein